MRQQMVGKFRGRGVHTDWRLLSVINNNDSCCLHCIESVCIGGAMILYAFKKSGLGSHFCCDTYAAAKYGVLRASTHSCACLK